LSKYMGPRYVIILVCRLYGIVGGRVQKHNVHSLRGGKSQQDGVERPEVVSKVGG